MARPKPKLTAEQIVELKKMATLGLSIDQMAPLLDISARTLERMNAENDAVSGAIKKGRAEAIIAVGKSAFVQAVSGKTPAMTMFYLKCRAGWKETQVHELSGPDGKPIETRDKSDLTDEQLSAKIQSLLKKQGKAE
jgi:hypothetical protein